MISVVVFVGREFSLHSVLSVLAGRTRSDKRIGSRKVSLKVLDSLAGVVEVSSTCLVIERVTGL